MTRQGLYKTCMELLKGLDLRESVEEQFLIAVKSGLIVIDNEDVENSKIPELIIRAAIAALSRKFNDQQPDSLELFKPNHTKI